MTERGHVSDEALVRLMDGELRAGERGRLKVHISACAACAGRLRELRETSGVVGEMLLTEVSPDDSLRARVRRGMEAERERGVPARARWGLVPAAVLLPLAAVLFAGVVLHRVGSARRMDLSGLAVPDNRLTPGETRPVALAELCAEGGDDFDPVLPASVQKAVFQEYGMNAGRPGEYQVDYLVSPQLGGTNSIQNLWPEPYGATAWNARAKDALEQRLRTMVCEGNLDLSAAQQAIRVDWIAAYRKYVGQP